MKNRLVELIDHKANLRRPWRDLENRTGISRNIWQKAYFGHQAVTADIIMAVVQHWPRYTCWFVTGSEKWPVEQSSPTIDPAKGILPKPPGSLNKRPDS